MYRISSRLSHEIRDKTPNLFYALETFKMFTHHLEDNAEASQWRGRLETWSAAVGRHETQQIKTRTFDLGNPGTEGYAVSYAMVSIQLTVAATCYPKRATTFCFRIPIPQNDAQTRTLAICRLRGYLVGSLPPMDLVVKFPSIRFRAMKDRVSIPSSILHGRARPRHSRAYQ